MKAEGIDDSEEEEKEEEEESEEEEPEVTEPVVEESKFIYIQCKFIYRS